MVYFLLKFLEIQNSRQYQIPPTIIIYREVGYCREIILRPIIIYYHIHIKLIFCLK